MNGYFKPWRRKIGVVTLVMACVCVVGWMRSLVTIDRHNSHVDRHNVIQLASLNGSIVWQRVVLVDASNWSDVPRKFFPLALDGIAKNSLGALSLEDRIQWKLQLLGFEIGEHRYERALGVFHVTIWTLSYWSLITPLTLLSAWLLLSKPRTKPTPQPTVESSPEMAT